MAIVCAGALRRARLKSRAKEESSYPEGGWMEPGEEKKTTKRLEKALFPQFPRGFHVEFKQ